MISYIKGNITFINPAYLIIETCGIGYHVNISLHTYAVLEHQKEVKILTYLQVKEDSHTLFGFATEEERVIFQHLISVSGVGSSTARIILSSLEPGQVNQAIIHEDDALFARVKGIGPKTAKRIILDLKDKIMKSPAAASGEMIHTPQTYGIKEEATAALIALGFNKNAVDKVIQLKLKENQYNDSLEQLVKQSLKSLSGQ